MQGPSNILLADDDDDDRLLFKDVLREYSQDSNLKFAHNGEHLMTLLRSADTLPDVLFLDLNMPLKNGMECLEEIRNDDKLKELPVIIFSTSNHPRTITQMYDIGAHLYIRKPNDFNSWRRVISEVLKKDWGRALRPRIEDFVLRV